MIYAALFLSMLLHELAHAAVATYYGDPQPLRDGRLTFNPFAHISLLWTILLPAITLVVSHGTFVFGSMKPIAITYSWMTSQQKWRVAAAGPAVNMVLAMMLLPFWDQAAIVNIMLAIVNLLPIKPLDGWRMLNA